MLQNVISKKRHLGQPVSQHAYDATSYDAATGTFTLLNLWGDYEPKAVTWAELAAFSPGITIAYPAPSTPGD